MSKGFARPIENCPGTITQLLITLQEDTWAHKNLTGTLRPKSFKKITISTEDLVETVSKDGHNNEECWSRFFLELQHVLRCFYPDITLKNLDCMESVLYSAARLNANQNERSLWKASYNSYFYENRDHSESIQIQIEASQSSFDQ